MDTKSTDLGFWRYWMRVGARAWRDTAALFPLQKPRQLFVNIVVYLVASYFLNIALGFDQMIEELNTTWSYVQALAIVAIAFYVVNFVTAPAKIDADRSDRISELELQIDDAETRQMAMDRLWVLRKEGVQLRKRDIPKGEAHDNQYDQWRYEFSHWKAQVINEARAVSPNLANWLEVLERQPNTPVVGVWRDEEHRKMLCVFSEILYRLGKFLEGRINKDLS